MTTNGNTLAGILQRFLLLLDDLLFSISSYLGSIPIKIA